MNRYNWVYEPVESSAYSSIDTGDIALSAPLLEVLYKRGYVSSSDIYEFFHTPLNGLIDPFLMKDMSAGVDRVISALKSKELICIFGDYDVDGVTSTSLMYLFLSELGGTVTHYIPNRLDEGYGLSVGAIRKLHSKGVSLIITVDCGISGLEEVDLANELGMDVVITDHHHSGDEVPAAVAIMNPMQNDDNYPFKSLAGVGVAFKLCMAIRHQLRKDEEWDTPLPNLKKYLDIVALGTIADVVPLVGENRTFVVHGLSVMSKNYGSRPGLDELKKVAGIERHDVQSSHIGFALAPRINAVGRLGDSERGFKLLVTDDRREASRLAYELDRANKDRQQVEREILAEVFKLIDDNNLSEKYSGLVLHSHNWHPGVLGIVASRVADKYFRPAIILTEEDGILKGSARSIPTFHLYNGLKEISDMLISFGGHKYAAGLKIDASKIVEFQEKFDKLVAKSLSEDDYVQEISIDALLEPEDIDEAFLEGLELFEPYGNCNREPIFCMHDVTLYRAPAFVGRDASHAKCLYEKDGIMFDSIAYNFTRHKTLLSSGGDFDIVFTISRRNGYRGSLQFVVKDIRRAEGVVHN